MRGKKIRGKAAATTLVGPYVASFLKEWLPVLNDRSEHTVKSYSAALRQLGEFMHLRHGIPPSRLSFEDLGSGELAAFLVWLEEDRGMKPSSVNTRLGAIKAFANYLQFENPALLDFCLTAGALKPRRVGETTVKFISKDAMEAVIGAAAKESMRDHAMLRLLYASGARESEFVGINVGAVRPGKDGRRMTVELHGKGRKARVVPLDRRTEAVMKAYMRNMRSVPTEPLFLNGRGGRITCSGLKYIVAKYGEAVRSQHPGLLDVRLTPHVFRHSIATHMLRAGVSLEFLRLFLGHSSIETTMVYAKVDPESVEKAVATISEGLIAGFSPLESHEEESLLSWLDEDYLKKHRRR